MPVTNQMSKSLKTDIANGIRRAMKHANITQSELARRMGTSRAVVFRLIRVDDTSLNINTLAKALHAVGCHATIRFKPR